MKTQPVTPSPHDDSAHDDSAEAKRVLRSFKYEQALLAFSTAIVAADSSRPPEVVIQRAAKLTHEYLEALEMVK